MVQWLGLHVSTAGDMGLIPDPGTKIPICCALQPRKKKIHSLEAGKYPNVHQQLNGPINPDVAT